MKNFVLVNLVILLVISFIFGFVSSIPKVGLLIGTLLTIIGVFIQLFGIHNTARALETSFKNVLVARYEFWWSTDWIDQNRDTFTEEFEEEKRKRGMV